MEFGSRVCFPQTRPTKPWRSRLSQIYAEWLSENLRDPRETTPLEVYTSPGTAEKCHQLSRFDLRNLPNYPYLMCTPALSGGRHGERFLYMFKEHCYKL